MLDAYHTEMIVSICLSEVDAHTKGKDKNEERFTFMKKKIIKAANFLNKYIYLCYEHYEKRKKSLKCFKQNKLI